MPKLILILLAVCLLSVQVDCRRKKPVVLEEQAPTVEEQTTVVEANHFTSKTERSTALNIGESIKDKPLVFLLEPSAAVDE